MAEATAIEAPGLAMPGIAHAFFTHNGGVSTGVYATLNGGTGSRDDPQAVAENRRRMAKRLGVAADRFLVPHLHHSADAVIVDAPWLPEARPRADAIVTATQGLALGPLLATRAVLGYFAGALRIGPRLLAATSIAPLAVHLSLTWLLTGLWSWSVTGAGLDGIAVTDHNEFRGALELQKRAPFVVIPAEEVVPLLVES